MGARWKVLITAPHLRAEIDRFRATLEARGVEIVLPPDSHRLNEDEMAALIHDVHGVICGDDRFTGRVIAAATCLKVISKWGVGVDAIDRAACARRGITVRNTPGLLADPVADTVMGYILCFARQLPWLDRLMKTERWERLPARALNECTLSIIGLGSVGQAVASRAAAFGMRLLGNDVVSPPHAFLQQTKMKLAKQEELLAEGDFVNLNCDLNPSTFHLIGDEELRLMKPSAVLINCARGALIDEPALLRALQQGVIAGAALDVFEFEPLPLNGPLRRMHNVLLAPHAANSSQVAFNRVHEAVIANLMEELERATAL